MSTCPACGSGSTAKLFEVTADQASRSFVSPRQYPDRSRKLISHLSLLWGRDTCDIRKCADCGFGFADPFVAGGAEFYNLAAPHPSYPTMKWEYERTIEELSGLGTAGKTAIDVGAGFGYFLDHIKDKLFRASDIYAVDYNEAAQQALRSKGYKTFSVDLREDGFTPMKEAFDIIFMFQVFEHMDRVDDVFARLKYLLKAQGSVFIAVPNDIRTHYMEGHGSLIDMPPNHIGRWTKDAFDAVCRRHGLQLSICEREPFNLLKFLTPGGQFDVAAYRHGIAVVTTAMEIIVDAAGYPTESIAKNSHDYRPLGLGYANLGSLLMQMGVPYDSDEGRAIASALTSKIGRAHV